MTHVITRACCNDAACVSVCPVNCIHPTPEEPGYGTAEMLYIDPEVCVDCAACVETCPVGAISADYDLAGHQAPYEAINARWFDAPGRRDYEPEQGDHRAPVWGGRTDEVLRVAVIGSGPAAFYAAEEILSRRGLQAQVDMFERLPVPGGLVRFGVAPDHQDTKDAAKAFTATMRRKGFRLFLNTEIGRDITIEDLRERYHAILVAVGALADRSLGVPGEELPGSHSATELVAWYNGHPDFAHRTFDLSGERAVIIGNGNVALDVARVLVSDPERLAATDIADHALAQLRQSSIREVVVVGRRGPAEAAFSTKELLALTQTPGIDVVVRPEELSGGQSLKEELLTELPVRAATHERRIVLRFLAAPTEIIGDGWVEGVRLQRTRLETADDGSVRAAPTDDTEELAASLVFRSVGYRGVGVPGVPFDAERGVIPNDHGRITEGSAGTPLPGLYVAGWIKRGPSGVIGTNKRCARESVAALLEDYQACSLDGPSRADDISALLPDHVGVDGWRLIDEHERSTGKSQHRPRVKIVELEEMLAIARQGV